LDPKIGYNTGLIAALNRVWENGPEREFRGTGNHGDEQAREEPETPPDPFFASPINENAEI
jgi:hypothetical protein